LDVGEGVHERDLSALLVHEGQVHQRLWLFRLHRRPDLGGECLQSLGLARLDPVMTDEHDRLGHPYHLPLCASYGWLGSLWRAATHQARWRLRRQAVHPELRVVEVDDVRLREARVLRVALERLWAHHGS